MKQMTLDKVIKNSKSKEILLTIIGGNEELENLLTYLEVNNIKQSNFICNLSESGYLGYLADYMDSKNMVYIPLFTLSKEMLEIAGFINTAERMKKYWHERKLIDYLTMLHRRYYPEFIRELGTKLIFEVDSNILWECFEHIWVDSEYLNGHVPKSILLNFFKMNPNLEKERKSLLKFVDDEGYITIYRGEASKSASYLTDGISWTIDKSKAIWFAKRFDTDGDVYFTKIKPEQVLTYITSRSEEEIIFDASGHDGLIERLIL